MTTIKRALPYTRQLIIFALYDVLEREHCEYQAEKDLPMIIAKVNVYDNTSTFCFEVKECVSATELCVSLQAPCEGLSSQGEKRAVNYLADRVEQVLENELKV